MIPFMSNVASLSLTSSFPFVRRSEKGKYNLEQAGTEMGTESAKLKNVQSTGELSSGRPVVSDVAKNPAEARTGLTSAEVKEGRRKQRETEPFKTFGSDLSEQLHRGDQYNRYGEMVLEGNRAPPVYRERQSRENPGRNPAVYSAETRFPNEPAPRYSEAEGTYAKGAAAGEAIEGLSYPNRPPSVGTAGNLPPPPAYENIEAAEEERYDVPWEKRIKVPTGIPSMNPRTTSLGSSPAVSTRTTSLGSSSSLNAPAVSTRTTSLGGSPAVSPRSTSLSSSSTSLNAPAVSTRTTSLGRSSSLDAPAVSTRTTSLGSHMRRGSFESPEKFKWAEPEYENLGKASEPERTQTFMGKTPEPARTHSFIGGRRRRKAKPEVETHEPETERTHSILRGKKTREAEKRESFSSEEAEFALQGQEERATELAKEEAKQHEVENRSRFKRIKDKIKGKFRRNPKQPKQPVEVN